MTHTIDWILYAIETTTPIIITFIVCAALPRIIRAWKGIQ
jgi:hypothetical protein